MLNLVLNCALNISYTKFNIKNSTPLQSTGFSIRIAKCRVDTLFDVVL